jgi:hypothetical protein
LIGIPLDHPLVLTEPFEFKEGEAVDEMGLLRSAFEHRQSYRPFNPQS